MIVFQSATSEKRLNTQRGWQSKGLKKWTQKLLVLALVFVASACAITKIECNTEIIEARYKMDLYVEFQRERCESEELRQLWMHHGNEVVGRVIKDFEKHMEEWKWYNEVHLIDIGDISPILYCPLAAQPELKRFSQSIEVCRSPEYDVHDRGYQIFFIERVLTQHRDSAKNEFNGKYTSLTEPLLRLVPDEIFYSIDTAIREAYAVLYYSWPDFQDFVSKEEYYYKKLIMLKSDNPLARLRMDLIRVVTDYMNEYNGTKKPLFCAIYRTVEIEWFQEAFMQACAQYATGDIVWDRFTISFADPQRPNFPTQIVSQN